MLGCIARTSISQHAKVKGTVGEFQLPDIQG